VVVHAFFANSVCGVYRGWFGDVVDFTSSNTVVVGPCTSTYTMSSV
jgi:hypothetical protein